MVKLSIDTNRDAVEDLEEAIEILQEAVTRRRTSERLAEDQGEAPTPSEETALDAGFFKITVESEAAEEPSLNELINEPITDSELSELFDEEETKKEGKEEKEEGDEDTFIEIVEFEDDD